MFYALFGALSNKSLRHSSSAVEEAFLCKLDQVPCCFGVIIMQEIEVSLSESCGFREAREKRGRSEGNVNLQ